jgi:hypothetical protein
MDFVHDQLSREALAIAVDYRLNASHVVETLEKLRPERGLPGILSVDNARVRLAIDDRVGRRATSSSSSFSPASQSRTPSSRASHPKGGLDGLE